MEALKGQDSFPSFRGRLNRSQAKPQSYLKHLHEQNTPVLSTGRPERCPKSCALPASLHHTEDMLHSTQGPGQAKPATATRTLLTVQTEFFVVDNEELESDLGRC